MPITITIIAVQGQICSPFSNSVNRMFRLIKNEPSLRHSWATSKSFSLSMYWCVRVCVWVCVRVCVFECVCVCVYWLVCELDSTFVCPIDLPLPAFRFSVPFFFVFIWFFYVCFCYCCCFYFSVILKTPQNRFELNVRLAQLFVVVVQFICLYWHFTKHNSKRFSFWHQRFLLSIYILYVCIYIATHMYASVCECPLSDCLGFVCECVWVSAYLCVWVCMIRTAYKFEQIFTFVCSWTKVLLFKVPAL